MTSSLRYVVSIRHASLRRWFVRSSGVCSVCGAESTFQYFDVINDRLAKEWSITSKLQKAYSERESMHCSSCRCSSRLRALAKAVSIVFGDSNFSLEENIESGVFKNKHIAEINACGDLHKILSKIKGLRYSEYAPSDKKIKNEDLQNLSYKAESFDLVLTSDTLEHVPDYKKALTEINRTLKPGGYHIFTIPLIFSRKTKRRIMIAKGVQVETMEPSYHGAGEADNLVCSEFGIDFLKDLKRANFKTHIYFANPMNKNEVNYVFVCRKV